MKRFLSSCARLSRVVISIGVAAVLGSLAVSSPAFAENLYMACQSGSGGWQIWDTQTGQYSLGSGISAGSLTVVSSGTFVYSTDIPTRRIALSSTDGSLINPSFITPSGGADALTISENVLYSVGGSGVVSTWDATTGASINANLVSGLNAAFAMLVSGSSLYVGEIGGSNISQWNAATGQVINSSFITGFAPFGLASSGTRLFASNLNASTVGVFDLATGSVIDANFITGVPTPKGLAVSGSTLYVASCDTGSYIGTYNVNTGAAINSQYMLINAAPNGLFIAPVPEPSTVAMALVGLACGGYSLFRRRRAR
jgi:PEP-CTERM motif